MKRKTPELTEMQREWLTHLGRGGTPLRGGKGRGYGEYEMPLGVASLIKDGLARLDGKGIVRPTPGALGALAALRVAPKRNRIQVTIEVSVPMDWTIGIIASELERVLRAGLPAHSEPEVGDQRAASPRGKS